MANTKISAMTATTLLNSADIFPLVQGGVNKKVAYSDIVANVKDDLSLASTDISDFSEAAQDSVGAILTNTATVTLTYDDGLNTITADVIQSGIDHGSISGLGDDDHTQYHNDVRGDARYYTQTQLNAGQLDTRYYTESEVDTLLSNKQNNITGAASTVTTLDLTTNRVVISNGSGKIAASTVTTTTLGFLDATSSIQTQLDGKQATITGAASTITSTDLTINRALISNGSGKVAVSSVTSTELGYLSGVNAAIQTQLNSLSTNKVDRSGDAMTGNLQVPNLIVAEGADGYIMLNSQSGVPPTTLIDSGIQIYSIDNEHFSMRGTNSISNVTMSLRVSELTADRILRFKDEDGYILTNNLGSGRILLGDASDLAQQVAISGDINLNNAGVASINDDTIVNSMVNDNAQIAGTKLRPSVYSLADAATISVPAASGNQFEVTITANRTLGNPTGAYNGQILLFTIRQNGTGGWTLAADTKYRFNDVFSDFELNAAANKVTYILCRYHSVDDKFDVLDIRRMD